MSVLRRHVRLTLAPLLAAALVCASAAQAAIVADDDFESYELSAALDGLDGGSGWSTPWRGVAGVTISNEEVALGGLGGGKSLKIAAHADNALGRDFFPGLETGGTDYFVSFLFRIVGPNPDTNVSGNVFTGWQAADDVPEINVDNIGYIGSGGLAGARVNNTSAAISTPLRYGQTGRLVVKYTGWSGGRYRKTQVWLNPAPADETSTNTAITRGIETATGGSEGIRGLFVRAFGLNADTYHLIDELRVGHTWSDVVPGGTFTVAAGPDWTPLSHSLDVAAGGVFDFSAQAGLDAPAGKHGHLVATPAGHFEFENRPGQRVRFWGVNLTYAALFLTEPQADKLAERLARSGYNTVRIHHYDRDLVGTSFDDSEKRSWNLDSAKLEQLDYLFAALKQRGIYINIDLFSDRDFSSAEAAAVGVSRTTLNEQFKTFVRINDDAFDSWKNFAAALLNHYNPHTKMTWGADPALIGICPVNEDPTQEVYGDQPALFHARFEQLYPQWVGVPKTDAARTFAFNRFIFQNNIDFDERCRTYLRDTLQTRALITGANFTISQGLTFVRAGYDYVDNHIYQDHPSAWTLPITFEQSNSTGTRAYVPTRMAPSRIFGRPFTSTEFHFSRPNRHRAEGALLMPAYASLQDWDGMYNFHYATSLASVTAGSADNYFSLANDPVGLVGDRLGSLLFQREDIKPAQRALVYAVREAEAYNGAYNASKDTYTRKEFAGDFRSVGLVARIGSLPGDPATILKNNPQLNLAAAVVGSSPALSPLPARTFVANSTLLTTLKNNYVIPGASVPSTSRLISDTGQLDLDSVARTFRAVTDRGEHFLLAPGAQLAGIRTASVVNSSDVPAVVSVLALKNAAEIAAGAPVPTLASARRILVTHLTDALTTGMRFANSDRKILQSWGALPHLVRRGEASLTVRLPAGDWRAWSVDITGARVAAHPLTRTATPDIWQMDLSTVGPAGARLAYELEFAPPSAPLPPATYAEWNAVHFTPAELAAPAVSGPSADPDGDGVANLLEYALAGDPRDHALAPAATLQVAPLPAEPSSSALALAFHRIADPALVYRVQASEDLASPGSWADIWQSTGEDNVAGPVTVVDAAPLGSRPRRFLRLQVGEAPSFTDAPEPLVDGEIYRISPMHARRLNLESTGTGDSADVRVATTAYTPQSGITASSQLWKAVRVSGTTWQFIPQNATTYRLNATGLDPGGDVDQSTGTAAAQQWVVTADNKRGAYELKSAASSLCLDAAQASGTSGASVQIYSDNNTGAQRWKFARTPGSPSNKPTPENTGVRPGVPLTEMGALIVTTNGASYENIHFTGLVKVRADDVTFLNCRFSGWGGDSNGVGLISNQDAPTSKGLWLEDCTMDPTAPSKYTNGFEGHDVTMRRCKLINTVDGLMIKNPPEGYQSNPMNVYVEACYIGQHSFFSPLLKTEQSDQKTHNDGVQVLGGSNINFTGNWITGMLGSAGTYDPAFPPPPAGQANAAFMIKSDSGYISGVHIRNNWLGGGSYTINVASDSDRPMGNIGVINDNIFARNTRTIPADGFPYTIVLNDTTDATTQGNVHEDGTAIKVRRY